MATKKGSEVEAKHRTAGGVRNVRRMRPVVDWAMAACYLLQMMPARMGGLYHEVAGIGFLVLLVVHHVLNWEWLKAELWRPTKAATRLALVLDAALLLMVIATIATGLLIARHLTIIAVSTGAARARSIHSFLTYAGLMLMALHAGLHIPLLTRASLGARVAAGIAALALGAWAFVTLGVASKLTFGMSFPDGVTPMPILLLRHVALAASVAVLGMLLREAMRDKGHTSKNQ